MDEPATGLTVARLCELLGDFEPSAYSGRYMYGKHCLAVETHEKQSLLGLLSDIIEGCHSAAEVAEVVRSARTDNSGEGTVIYWPDIEVPKGFYDRD